MAQVALKAVPEIGSNSFELTEKERQALLINGLNEIEGFTEEKDAVVARIRTSRKRLVAHGFKPNIINFALRLRKNDNKEEIEQRKAEIEVARFLNHPIGTQPDMFDQPDRTPDVDKARALGEIAGAEGKKREPPYAPGTAQEQAWLTGWSDGQQTLASAFKKLEAKAAAEPAEESEESEAEDE